MVYVRVWESEIWLKVKWKWSENVGKKMTLWRLNISPQLKVLHVLMQPCIEFPELCDGTFFCWKISKWQLLFVVGSCVTTISISLCNNTSFSCLWLVLVWQPKVFPYVATFLLLDYGWFLCDNHQYCKCWFLCDNTFIFLFLATTKNRLEISIIWMHSKWWFSNVCINHSILLVLFNKVYWSMLNA